MSDRYKRYFDASPEARFVAGRDGRLREVNQAAADVFGFPSVEAMLCLPCASELYCQAEDREVLQQRIEAEGTIRDFAVEMRRCNGERFIASISANLWVDDDGTILYEGFLHDLSDSRHWQTALIESEKRGRELHASAVQAQQTNEEILHLLMVMSHDIRGPLVAIAATLKLLIRGFYGSMDESVGNTLRDLLARVAQLLGMAEDFLAKANAGQKGVRSTPELLDLRQDIIDPILEELANDFEQHAVRIDNRLGAIPGGTILVSVNKVWLKAVFRNLFRNAVKYGGDGCRIAFGFEDHGSYYRLNVYNSGSPVPEERRAQLFTRYGRIVEKGQAARDGLGLGLYLIRDMLIRHGGDMWYEARPDGSDFIFTLLKERG